MEFVKVRHSDGRDAEITAAEVAFYRSIGFTPEDGAVIEGTGATDAAAAPVQSPANGTDQRLDLLIDEMRGLRADLASALGTAPAPEPVDGETVELREPQVPDSTTGGEDVSADVPSDTWTRADLDAYAAAHGIADADKLPNKQAVLDAIEAAV